MENEKKELQQDAMKCAITLEEQRRQAMLQGSLDLLDPLLSDSLYYGHSSGYGDNKQVFLQQVKDKVYHYLDINLHIDGAAPVGDDGLVINGKVTLKVTADGGEKTMHSVYLAVWRKEAGTWRFLAHQTTLQKN